VSGPQDHRDGRFRPKDPGGPGPDGGAGPGGIDGATWRAYREGRLDAEARRAVEEALERLDLETAFDAEAEAGLEALGPERADRLTAAIERDLAVLAKDRGERAAFGRKAGGRVRRLGPLRYAAAAVLFGALLGGLFGITRSLQRQADRTALERHDEGTAPSREDDLRPVPPAAATEQLPAAPRPGQGVAAGAGDSAGKALAPAPERVPAVLEEAPAEEAVADDVVKEEAEEAAAAVDIADAEPVEPLLEERTLEDAEFVVPPVQAPVPPAAVDDAAGLVQKAGPSPSPGMGGTLGGVVTDAGTGEPLPFANVVLSGTEGQTGAVTDMEGRFELHAPEGDYTLRTQSLSYATEERPVTVDAESVTRLDLALEPEDALLESVTIASQERRGRDRKARAERETAVATDLSGTPARQASADEAEAAPPTEALLERARGELDGGRPGAALETLRAVPLRPAGENALADEAVILRARAELELGDPATAESLLAPLRDRPGAHRDAARYLTAEARWRQGRESEARTLWEEMAYGSGEWADAARRRLAETGR
jgi:hypothetical protein